MLKTNILLVDDEPANLIALCAILADLGQNLVEARSGGEAVSLIARADYAVILLDVRMRGLDGFEAAERIRGQEKARHTPIIFLTAYDADRGSIERAYALGAVDYLVKPLVPVMVRAKVKVLVELHKATEEVRRQAALLAQAEALKEADRRKDEFLATLGHELRTPLAPVRNALELLRHAEGDRVLIEKASDIMERQVSQMVRLIDDLLDVTRITQGKLELRRARVELSRLMTNAVETSRPLMEQMSHELCVVLPLQPIYLHADAMRITQVLQNLLNNAAKYTEQRGCIWLTGERQDQEVVIKVRDNGIGIAADKLPRVFDVFTQVEQSLERSQGGLGLGLALVKRLAEMHGGTVEAKSAGLGNGSEFTVRLPVAISST